MTQPAHAALTHAAVPIGLVNALIVYLKSPTFDFDTAAALIAGLASSPPVEVITADAPPAAGQSPS